jgi:hypothetical protein
MAIHRIAWVQEHHPTCVVALSMMVPKHLSLSEYMDSVADHKYPTPAMQTTTKWRMRPDTRFHPWKIQKNITTIKTQ